MILPCIRNIINIAKSSISKFETKLGFCLNRLNQFIKVHKNKNNKEENNIVYKILCNKCDPKQTKNKLGQIKRHNLVQE